MRQQIRGYAGTYETPAAQGIYRFILDCKTGWLTLEPNVLPVADAKYLCLQNGVLAATTRKEGRAGIHLENLRTGQGTESFYETVTPCYVAMDQNRVYTANFHEGALCVYERPGLSLIGIAQIAPKAGCHQVLPQGDRLLVPCMNLDAVKLFHRKTLALIGEFSCPSGSGPRHGVFTRSGKTLFLAAQCSQRVMVFHVEGDICALTGEFPVLPRPGTPADETAAIRLSSDERFLYVSTRGADLLTVFRVNGENLIRIQHISCGGKHPRDFILSLDEKYMLVANRYEGGIVCFSRDQETGLIGNECGRIAVPEAVALVLDAETNIN